MIEAVVSPHEKVCVRIVYGLTECDYLGPVLAKQRQALRDDQIVKLGSTSRFQPIRPDLHKTLHTYVP